jgi:hypothetical protein
MAKRQPQTVMGYERVGRNGGLGVLEPLFRDPRRAGSGNGQERKTRRTRRRR